MKTRAQAALVIQQVLDQGQSLSAVLPAAQEKVAPRDRALLQELCYGTLRWLPRLDAAVGEMMDKPLKNKSRIFHYLILVGLYQLIYTRIPAHAAVAETVNAVKLLKGTSLRGLINGVLRNFQRSAEVILLRIDRVPSIRLGHPEWLTKRLRQAYPDDWEFIMEANNQRPPMWIRNNSQRQSREQMLARMAEAGINAMAGEEGEDCILLERPCDVTKLPGFEVGDCSVQDGAAQQAAALLDPQPGEWVLDACAAPGGKTAHLLELCADARVTALEIDATRPGLRARQPAAPGPAGQRRAAGGGPVPARSRAPRGLQSPLAAGAAQLGRGAGGVRRGQPHAQGLSGRPGRAPVARRRGLADPVRPGGTPGPALAR